MAPQWDVHHASTMFRYECVVAGVDRSPGQKPLAFAEKDASDFARFLTSAQGPLHGTDPHELLLVGAAAKRSTFQARLAGMLGRAPDCLLVYFSGHGGPTGVAVGDGLMPYSDIIDLLRLVDAPRSIVILDVCHAASYLDFLKEAGVGGLEGLAPASWLDVLAHATEGTRLVFSTGKDRGSGEGGTGIQNGHFTRTLLEVLQRSAGDLKSGAGRWVSDRRAFALTRRTLEQFSKGKQVPVERNLRGDFPLALSQVDHPIGDALLHTVEIAPSCVEMHFVIEGRRHLDSSLEIEVRNGAGLVIDRATLPIEPADSDVETYSGTYCLNSRITDNAFVRYEQRARGAARIEWVLRIVDKTGRVYDERVAPAILRRPA
jgi:hypothetical protein